MKSEITVSKNKFFRQGADGLWLCAPPSPHDFLCPECSARLFTSDDIDWSRYDQLEGTTKTLVNPNYDNDTGRLTCTCGFTIKLRLFSWRN